MRKHIAAAMVAIVATCALQAVEPVDYVSTLVGTQSDFTLSTGNTYPAITLPWAMNTWTPQTGKMGDGWAYTYDAKKLRGIKQTHQPSPWINDYGQFAIMPVTGDVRFNDEERACWFSHKAEIAKPYYYSVYLADYDVTAELTPTMRAAAFRFTYPESDLSTVVIDALDNGSHVRIDTSAGRITGYTTKNSGGVPQGFKNYFIIEFDTPITFVATSADGEITEGSTEATANHAGAIVGFKTRRGQQVNMRVASSFISTEQAAINLLELGDGNFDRICREARDRWNQVLGRIDVEQDRDNPFALDQMRTFYSCLYRSVIFPHAMYEINARGEIVHYSPYNGEVLPGYMFTDTGFWDTFRSLFPLLNLIYPSENLKIQEGLVNAYLESGFLPEWASPGHRDCMVGQNSASVVADAYVNGVRVADGEKLWQAATAGAHKVHPRVRSTGRLGHEYYDSIGYVPCDVDIKGNAARTMEYAYNDWCIYRLGKSLGKSDTELVPYARGAFNYANLFDPETKVVRGRKLDGTFSADFNPVKWSRDFTEGNAWHYIWETFHDPQGVIDLMGGDKQYIAMLDSVFKIPANTDDAFRGRVIHEMREMQIMDMGNYAHGNQPVQHMPYLYGFTSEPWKAQYWIREIMNKMYSATPDGYCGDEDNGQTSAWYVFSALGFYPVAPGSGEYVLGTPLFKHVKLHLENGKTVNIQAPDNSIANRYVRQMLVDGKVYDKNYITRTELYTGPTITYEMSEEPNRSRAIGPEARPYSFSNTADGRKFHTAK